MQDDDDEDEEINPEIEEIIDYQEKLKQETRERWDHDM